MKKILCFGDSNTYGYKPVSGDRYDENTRWAGIIKQKLKPDYEVIEAGANNRNGFVESNCGDELTGYKVLPKYLSKNPDIVILAIGINDVQKFYRPDLSTISAGLESMVKSIIDSGAKLVLISPPVLNDDVLRGNFSFQFDEESVSMSKKLPALYKETAKKYNCHYIDLNKHVYPSKEDGLHYTKEGHNTIANLIYNCIIKIS